MNIHQATKMNRRRFTAFLGALSLYPTIGRAATTADKYICKNYVVDYSGTSEFSYLLTGQQPTAMQGKIRVDMWTPFDGPKTQFGIDLALTNWAADLLADNKQRRAHLNTQPASTEKDSKLLEADNKEASTFGVAGYGWMDIEFLSRPSQLNQIFLKSLTFRLPPVGTDQSFGIETADVKTLIDGEVQFTLPYTITRKESNSLMIGAEPKVTIEAGYNTNNLNSLNKQARILGNELLAGKKLTIEAYTPKGKLLIKLEQYGYFNLKESYNKMVALAPAAKQKTLKAMQGNFSDCEKTACYLTTASVFNVGLADDCWELQILRQYRNTYLDIHSFGRKLIDDYYKLAPDIVHKINSLDNAQHIWLRTYIYGILPAAICAKLNLNKTALKIYHKMTLRLSALAPK